MTNPNLTSTKQSIFKIAKWILSVIFVFAILGSLLDKAFLSAVIFLIIALLLMPPLTEFWKSKFNFLNNKLIKGGLLFVLFVVGVTANPNISKNNSKTNQFSSSDEMEFEDKEDILIDYVKKNITTDKSIQNISKLGEIGEFFNKGNYSTVYPNDGYISEQMDSLSKKKILVFNPRFDFESENTYLLNDAKNGKLVDYIIHFEVDNSGKIVSKKTYITYSKTGKVEYENNKVPDYNTLIDKKIIENQKLNNDAEVLVAKQQEANEKRKKEFEEKCLDGWDGSHTELVRMRKKTMGNPKSFEHVETTYRLFGDYAVVYMKYRGENSFGAVILTSLTAKVSLEDCSVISVEE
ncbi:hypothetical protein [Flavobacterium sp.]|uniref:hypothetical protein n=1 Tax=Flavobacterium sp. TaxID=239 RepID=UPI00375001DB